MSFAHARSLMPTGSRRERARRSGSGSCMGRASSSSITYSVPTLCSASSRSACSCRCTPARWGKRSSRFRPRRWSTTSWGSPSLASPSRPSTRVIFAKSSPPYATRASPQSATKPCWASPARRPQSSTTPALRSGPSVWWMRRSESFPAASRAACRRRSVRPPAASPASSARRAGPTPPKLSRVWRYLLRMSDAEVLGLLVATRDEPGVLYRISEAIFKHGANVTYIAGGAHREHAAELQLEVTGARDEATLIADLVGLEGVTKVSRVPTFQRIYGKRVIVVGGGAQVGMVAQGAISEADRHNIRGAVREIKEAGIIVLCTNMAGSVPDAADVVVSDPVEAGVMAVMLIADTASFSIDHVRGRRF